jgi:hypothetical protein
VIEDREDFPNAFLFGGFGSGLSRGRGRGHKDCEQVSTAVGFGRDVVGRRGVSSVFAGRVSL